MQFFLLIMGYSRFRDNNKRELALCQLGKSPLKCNLSVEALHTLNRKPA